MASDPSSQPDQPKYWAFISYSHDDEELAGWLHRSLETYRVPSNLIKEGKGRIPRRLHPVFRDREELASGSNLPGRINDALRESRHLIVICSPRAAQSKWVDKEIRSFKTMGGTGRVHCFIVDGEPNANPDDLSEQECLPPPIRFELDARGVLTETPTEPLAADAREGKDGKRNALLKLVAGMLGLGYDDLKQREQIRQRRRRRNLALLGTAAAIVLAALGWQLRLNRIPPGTLEWDTTGDVRLNEQGNDLAVFYNPADMSTVPTISRLIEKMDNVELEFHDEDNCCARGSDDRRYPVRADAHGVLRVEAKVKGKTVAEGRVYFSPVGVDPPDDWGPASWDPPPLPPAPLDDAALEKVHLSLQDADGKPVALDLEMTRSPPLQVTRLDSVTVLVSDRVTSAALDGFEGRPGSGPHEWQLSDFPLMEGENELTVVLTDILNRQYEAIVSVVVDNTPPEVPQLFPSIHPNNPVGQEFGLRSSVLADDHVQSVRVTGDALEAEVSRGREELPPPVTDGELEHFEIFGKLVNPFGTIAVTVVDWAGNESRATMRPVDKPRCEYLFDERFPDSHNSRWTFSETCPTGKGGFVDRGVCNQSEPSRFGEAKSHEVGWALGFARPDFEQTAGIYTGEGGLEPDFTLALWVLSEGREGAIVVQGRKGGRKPADPGPELRVVRNGRSYGLTFVIPKTGSEWSELELQDPSFVQNTWVFYAVTAQRDEDSTIMKLYRNLELVDEKTQRGNYRTSNKKDYFLFLGNRDTHRPNLQFDGFTGILDDVRTWNRALSAKQVRMLYIEEGLGWRSDGG